jgi:hypothetical protein
MHVNAKKLAFLGLLLSIAVILVILGSILEFNTLFLLVAASFCVGIAIRETRLRMGFGFYIASILLSLILSPNKFYCITFSAMGLYLLVAEYAFEKLTYVKSNINRRKLLWLIKYIVYNLMFVPILLVFPKLIYTGHISHEILATIFLAGQFFLLIYDKAYDYFQSCIWEKLRGHLHL